MEAKKYMKKKTVKIIFAFLFTLMTAFIWKNSAKDAVESTNQSSGFVAFFLKLGICSDIDMATVIVRKLAHFTEFFMQSAFLSVCLLEDFPKRLIYVLFSGLLTASIDEFIQSFFAGRGSLVSDIFIDFSGTVFCVIIFMLLWLLIKKFTEKQRGKQIWD